MQQKSQNLYHKMYIIACYSQQHGPESSLESTMCIQTSLFLFVWLTVKSLSLKSATELL